MNQSIVAHSPMSGPLDAAGVAQLLSLQRDVPVPVMPEPPTLDELDGLPSVPDPNAGYPAEVGPGSTELTGVLDEMVGDVEALRRRLINTPPAGFMVTAADGQRATEIMILLDQVAAILAERA